MANAYQVWDLGLTSLGYQDNVTFPWNWNWKWISRYNLDLHVNYLICKEICIPGDARIFLDIPAGEKKLMIIILMLNKLPEKDFSRTYLKNINANVLRVKIINNSASNRVRKIF